jgi:1,4-alpha-glucan branching enzyme
MIMFLNCIYLWVKNMVTNALGLQQVQAARRQLLPTGSALVGQIQSQESVQSIFSRGEDYRLRTSLYTASATLKSEAVFSKTLIPHHSKNQNLQALEQKCDKLRALKEVLDKRDVGQARQKFLELPLDARNYLSWAVWFKDCLANKNSNRLSSLSYGTDEIGGDVLTLRESADKVIYLRGEGLVEQLLLYVEDQLSVERQEENVRMLGEIAQLIENHSKKDAILAKFEELPLELQWKIHVEVQNASGGDRLGFEWGKRKIYENPEVLAQLKSPQSGKTLLQHLSQAQKELLECCKLAADVNEFEKMAVLFPLSNDPAQREELKKWLGRRAREWVCSLEAAKGKQSVAPLPALQKQVSPVEVPNTVSSALVPPHSSNQSLQPLKHKCDKLRELKEFLDRQDVGLARQNFLELPSDVKSDLSWAVWFKDYLANKNSDRLSSLTYGTDEISRNILSLRESADKVIYLRGEGLVEQLLLCMEERLSVQKQKENVRVLNEIAQLIEKRSNKDVILAKFEELPLELQWEIHVKVQNASGGDRLGFEWGKRKIYENPEVLAQLKSPQSGETPLQHLSQDQKRLLEECELAADVSEFEKIKALFPLSNDQAQKEILKKQLTPRVLGWVGSLKAVKGKAPVALPASQAQVSHAKLYESRGAHYQNGSTTFRVYAPQAQEVFVVLTAFGREEHRVKMQKNSQGEWEAATPLAAPGRTYVYLVRDCNGKEMRRTDPFSFSKANVPEVGQVQSVVVDLKKYRWNDQAWMAQRKATDPLQAPLSIYELQLKSWKSGTQKPPNFREMAPELIAYCKKMGFTHVEVFGLLEHVFKDARGYQVVNFFAPYNECGGCDDFKYLVDQLHQNGIGVIVDWIPTHFQHRHQSESYSFSMHEFDGTNMFSAEDSPWGTRYLDYSKEETRRLMFASAMYYLDQLHVDGLRYDAISQLVHRDGQDVPAGISFLKELNDCMGRDYPGVMKIAEETEGFPNVTKPTREGGLGFDMKWNIGWSHDSRNFLRTPYSERQWHWQQKVMGFLNGNQNGEKVILTHSHDDTDSGENDHSKTLMSCVAHLQKPEERFANLRNFFSWQALAPSHGHMIHMGDEFGQPQSWYDRFRKNLSSVDWSLENASPAHRGVQNCIADLNTLYRSRPQLSTQGESGFKLIAEHAPNTVVAYHRGTKEGKRVAVVHNFSNNGYASYDIPLPSSDALVKRIRKVDVIFNSDDVKYGGSSKFGNRSVEVIRNPRSKEPSHLRMALPPLSTVVLEEELS